MKRIAVLLTVAAVVLTAGTAGQAPERPRLTEPNHNDYVHTSPEDDTLITSVFTLAEIIIFSYHDSTSFRVLNPTGAEIWSGMLDEGDYYTLFPGQGVFVIRGSNKYSVLIGDPLTDQVQGFYAVDENNKGVSERFFTLQTSSWGGAEFIVFAYEDSTFGEIRESASGTIMHSFELDSVEHYSIMANSAAVEVVANKGVSLLSYGDQGYWVPAANGSFSGQLFYTFRGYIGSWPNDINVIAYYDKTHVVITNTETEELLWEGDLDDGELQTLPGSPQPIYVTVEASKDVTCLVAPFESYTSAYARLYNGMDRSGRAIGKKFYHPTISGGRIDLYSFYDENHVHIFNQLTGAPVWDGVLDAYEYHTIQSTLHRYYRIESDSGVALYDEMGDRAGAIFAPMWYATFDPIETIEELEVSESETYILPVIVDDELVVCLSNSSCGRVKLELFDVTGRNVLSRTVCDNVVRIDVSGLSQGVYIVNTNTGDGNRISKIVIR